ncbi:AEH_G0033340.mRNA.1.CDS.1 [Saccharomyces cerevisiae]|nr:AEH_G0033340.mRNA.1.CDS.1 [Saccharomyces cerevisiae]CAI6775085.1 AEH_G0033340.mRNA.1.CDS.1 [Saccharomyces cerevisiae]
MEIDGNTLVFIIVILFLFFSSPGGDGVSSQYEFNQLQRLKQQFRTEHNTFVNMTYTDSFRNITGLKLSYQDMLNNPLQNATYPLPGKDYDRWFPNQNYMVLPNEIIEAINTEVWNTSNDDASNLFPPNITSTLLGKIDLVSNNKYEKIRMPVPRFYEPATDFSEDIPPEGETYWSEWPSYGELHNVSFQHGEIAIQISHMSNLQDNNNYLRRNFINKKNDRWKLLNLQIDFSDKAEKEKHSIYSKAVYDIQRGRILSISQSSKFHSLFALPHYMSFQNDYNEKIFNDVKELVDEFWNFTDYTDVMTMKDVQDSYNNANFKCEYLIFLQLEPWNQYTRDQIKLIDDELNWPLGRPANLSSLPPINVVSGLLYSPDCGVRLGLHNVKGTRYELKIMSIRKHLLFGIALFAAQIYLLLTQMHHTNTPSMANKISFYCFSMINLVDGSLATLYFVAASVVPELYLPLVISAFSCFILASIFEIRYLISIYASQVNEQNVGIINLLRGNTGTYDENRPRPAFIPDEGSIGGSLYGRFFFMLIIFTFLILSSTSWPRQLRMVFEYILIFILNSYWIPQIFRNAVKGIPSRRERARSSIGGNRSQNKMPLLWSFVIGTTIIRSLPVVYVFTYSSNVFRHHKDVHFVVFLSLWLLFQISILYSQDVLGSRWFLPKHTIPDGYSYFKPLSNEYISEHGGGTAEHTVDCAICMSDVPIYIEEIPETHKVDQHSYMVTPCNHVFHTSCLENWMSYKLQCPVCRSPLPPL